MANRRGGLLAQIDAHVVDDGVPLSSLLQECVVLGARAGSEKMRDWARWELHGYTGADTVPEYRHFHAVLMAVITNNAGYNAITDRIHEDVFGDQIRDVIREAIGDIEDAFLPQGIGMLEGLTSLPWAFAVFRACAVLRVAPFTSPHARHSGCFSGSQWPSCLELATHWVMKFMPSTPSATLG